ncbi:hypothetical protein ENSA5_41910 [Enhygromyxa salina]|uniref:Cytochrome c domain-containing protein n=1 Tax=Enhygromyxa salina TaxID=215803 RepID=A0A2S9XM37_9BACT|nr:hypothetical protein [Enhygromyxa salina]PRP93790.1 hypothetical protein ENSA5_41910 [Enhygromyxa salina]
MFRRGSVFAPGLVALGFTLGCEAAPAPAPTSASEPPPVRASAAVEPDAEPEPAPEPWSDAWLEAEASRYLDDPSFRRQALEASLTNPDNQYSRKRLAAYGHADRGWDGLPQWRPKVTQVTTPIVEQLRETGELRAPPGTPLWDGQRPTSLAAWVELGERVFYDYPLRPELFARHALANPELAASVGLRPDPSGRWPGVVVFDDLDGQREVGITCALCHVGEDAGGGLVPGRAHRGLDYGAMRLAYYRDSNTPISAELAQRMASWGPGRADITDDEDEDPVAIPDLWRVRELTHLTQAATLRHDHPAALAIRQETQLLHANRERARPPRELAWALAMYVYSLAPPPRADPPSASASATALGRATFERACARCHEYANGSGEPVSARSVGTDPALALGRARGTGLYRPAALVRVADAGPYLHDGTVASLEDLLSPARLEPEFRAGVRGPGPVVGHRYGMDLPEDTRAALIAYLGTR